MPPHEPGEFARIAALRAALPQGDGVIVGPGDDAAVVRVTPGCELVVTTDTFVESVHFTHALANAQVVGERLAAANLSDVAAMGARPRWAVIALTAPSGADSARLHATELACAAALARQGVSVVGGNLTSAVRGPEVWTVTLFGEVAPGRAWTRAGAREGAVLAVTGTPGRAGEALARALALPPEPLPPAYTSPACRVPFALALAETDIVQAAIDVSDGFAGDLAHLCEASGVGARVDEEALGECALAHPLSDDYELLLALDPTRLDEAAAIAARFATPLRVCGTCTAAAAGRVLVRRDGREEPLRASGYTHF